MLKMTVEDGKVKLDAEGSFEEIVANLFMGIASIYSNFAEDDPYAAETMMIALTEFSLNLPEFSKKTSKYVAINPNEENENDKVFIDNKLLEKIKNKQIDNNEN